ncbi:LAFA_0F11782g1_1 [Lachancea sp. 'fantastica']|nr:LAFA_0F11782g1_1 [Lachancea sp. 'fantastica']
MGNLKSSLPYKSVVDLAFRQLKPATLNQPLKPIVVNLHGLFGSSRSFAAVSRKMVQDLNTEVYSLDLRNHGKSPSASPYDYLTQTRDVVKLLHDQFGKERPISIVGFSMGGKVGLLSALSRQINVVKCISIDMPPYKVSSIGKTFMENYDLMLKISDRTYKVEKGVKGWREKILKLFRALPSNSDPGYALYFAHGFLEVKDNDATFNATKDADPYVNYRLPLDDLKCLLNDVKDSPVIETLPREEFRQKAHGQILFMRGLRSPLFRDSHSSLLEHFPSHTVAEFNTGHIIMSEAPNEFYTSCIEFLSAGALDRADQ